MDILNQNVSQAVLAALKKQKKKKVWLYSKLEMTARTLDSRIQKNNWTLAELRILREHLGI